MNGDDPYWIFDHRETDKLLALTSNDAPTIVCTKDTVVRTNIQTNEVMKENS